MPWVTIAKSVQGAAFFRFEGLRRAESTATKVATGTLAVIKQAGSLCYITRKSFDEEGA